MLKKTIEIKTTGNTWQGTVIEYRLFGILLYKKELYPFNSNLDCIYDF